MPVVTLLGAKGGVGSSIVATNLALALNAMSTTLLIDLDLRAPSADLLLDVTADRSWTDLLPVAGELTERHLELASAALAQGLKLLAAPVERPSGEALERFPRLLRDLARHFTWIILDLGGPLERTATLGLSATDLLLLVMTPDPPALRGARRLSESLPVRFQGRTGLVINQHSRFHPVNPGAMSRSLAWPLMGVLPRESRLVAEQVNFGQPVMMGQASPFSREIDRLAGQVASSGDQDSYVNLDMS